MITREQYERLQQKAGRLTRKAIKDGVISKITEETRCVDCGKQAIEYDHRDYDKPLKVDPVCRSCNGRRGAALPLHKRIKVINGLMKTEGDESVVSFSGICHAPINEAKLEQHEEYLYYLGSDKDIHIAFDEIEKNRIKHGNIMKIYYPRYKYAS